MKPQIIKTLTALALSIATAQAATYSGSLSSSGSGTDGTLIGTEQWSSGATFSWTVTDEEATCTGWYYTYTLSVPEKDISHATTEVSSTFEASSLIGLVDPGFEVDDGALDNYGPGLHGNSDPGIPDNMRGIKVNTVDDDPNAPTVDLTSITWSLCSDRVPVWGDMYANDGINKDADKVSQNVYLYNTGFTAGDTDPDILISPAASGSVDNHILVPDSFSDPEGPPLPEPSTSMLGIIGLMMILRRRFR